MPNYNPDTGIRYGVIACNSLDDDLVQELFCGSQAKDLSYEQAQAECRNELESECKDIESDCFDEALCTLRERGINDPTGTALDELHSAAIDAAYERLGFDDRDEYIESKFESSMQDCHIEEPTIEGEYEGVKYHISWLGGAPILYVFEGPLGSAERLCSPCVPGAADLDSGFMYREAEDGGYVYQTEEVLPGENLCYCVPRDWLRKEDL